MNIIPTKTLSKDTVPVILLNEGQTLQKHPFFKLLAKPDQEFLSAFQKKSPLKDGHNHLVFLPSAKETMLIGLPASAAFTHRKAILAARRVVWFARREKVKQIGISLEDFRTHRGSRSFDELAAICATQWKIANFEFLQYKTPPKEGWPFVERVEVYAPNGNARLKEGLLRGSIVGEEMNKARVLSNMPGGDMTPKALANAAEVSGKECGFSVRILEENEIKKLGMGGVLGVSKGSSEPPRFIVMEYWGSRKTLRPVRPIRRTQGKQAQDRQAQGKPVVLVGKGVTFDSGGLNLKPEQGIYEMHMDMSGGAAVIHIIAALARMKVKNNIVGLIPAVENMPSGSSYHPGDQLKSMSGKTIEIINTDAEGRVILADALTYATTKYSPKLVIDVATLTGASMVALGQRASALFTTDVRLERQFREIGEATGDFVWPLPLWEEFEEEIKGTFGDVANSNASRYGGAIKGAVFLWQFIKTANGSAKGGFASGGKEQMANGRNHKPSAIRHTPIPWVHLDIAPRMTSVEGEFLAKGAAGAAIALLISFLQKP